jgi:hypothetical protein
MRTSPSAITRRASRPDQLVNTCSDTASERCRELPCQRITPPTIPKTTGTPRALLHLVGVEVDDTRDPGLRAARLAATIEC